MANLSINKADDDNVILNFHWCGVRGERVKAQQRDGDAEGYSIPKTSSDWLD